MVFLSCTDASAPVFMSRPSRSLLGKVAIVTGAGSDDDGVGNGRAISMLLAEDGASVVCVDVNVALAERTVAMIGQERRNGDQAAPTTALAVRADVSCEEDCAAVVEAALGTFGRVDILINNVGILGGRGTATDVDVQEWTRGLEVNVTSMMLMAKHAIPAMAANEPTAADGGIRGSIVNLGSVAGLRGGTPSLLYPTSKGAVVNMTRAMAAHHGPQGIRVNCVCPGTETPASRRRLPPSAWTHRMLYTPMVYNQGDGMTAEMRESRRQRSLLRTEGNAWDCAAAVRFLACGEARWITGTVLTVDAGATCSTGVPMNL
ncbi:short-chain type dehydrogenase [Drechmeria coniospora]|uniref:Short-chain type dehydrogenase n=1 Tax=Drechmeria coniospora TaxID=98403 RepID=A0A151GM65_DRECN|nr:short-chain type dehydrogenase [Drechmeria coniospora]KYK58168.1 short-chain type dehydrogenase [Drechmeria coniospora]